MSISIEDLRSYYKQTDKSDRIIKRELREDDKLILYGAKAINAQLPEYLHKHTEDWDIYTSNNPEKEAKEIEKLLDKKYGGDYFYVEPALHEGTFKIKSRVTDKGIADISILPEDREVPHKRIQGVKVATLDYHVARIKEILKDPEFKFRHAKDKETLQRINIYREVGGEANPSHLVSKKSDYKFTYREKKRLANKATVAYGLTWRQLFKTSDNKIDWTKLKFQLSG